ncbi:MAG TPA: peptidylprolyl isomerase [Gammaproteobacteria bacterium]|nr:peptidylprolyl isomerase [Gammaproteobacteria bacterium]
MSQQITEHQQHPLIHGVRVNEVLIEADTIAQELQYHPAGSAEEAINNATQALIIKQLLLEKSEQLGIVIDDSMDTGDSSQERRIQLLLEREIDPYCATEEECQQYYEANLDKFKSECLMEVAHILLAAPPEDFALRLDMRTKAEQIIEKLAVCPEEFPVLAREFSSCPSKAEGGSLGQISKGQTTREFERQLFLLEPGLCMSPIESRYGWHVVYVNHKVEGEQQSFDACKTRIKRYLQDQSYTQAVSQYIAILMQEAEIQSVDDS